MYRVVDHPNTWLFDFNKGHVAIREVQPTGRKSSLMKIRDKGLKKMEDARVQDDWRAHLLSTVPCHRTSTHEAISCAYARHARLSTC